MKVGLTGGTGFIGQYLINEYGSEMEFVVPTRRTEFQYLENNVAYIHIESEDDFCRVFSGCEAVIHLAGHVMHGMDTNLKVDDYVDNISLSERVFAACHELEIHNVINASSVAVYDQIDETPVKEDGVCQPNSIYGVMKIAVEKIAEIYNRRFDMNIKTLRLAQGVGVQKNMDEHSFWTLLIQNSYLGKDIPLYGEGITGRDIIYVKDMAYAIACAVGKPHVKGVFNIGTGKITSNAELAYAFGKGFGKGSGIEYIDKPESGIRTCMDISRAEQILGFAPRYHLAAMVADIKYEYQKMMGESNCG